MFGFSSKHINGLVVNRQSEKHEREPRVECGLCSPAKVGIIM